MQTLASISLTNYHESHSDNSMKPSKKSILNNIKLVLDEIAKECKELSLQVMASSKGFNDRPFANKNTLVGSKLYNELKTRSDGEGLIEIIVKDYIDYIQGGMNVGHWVPEKPLIDWMEEKGLPYTDNKIVRAIQASIFKRGITPRPIFEISPWGEWKAPVDGHDGLVLDLVDDYWEDWSEELFDAASEFLDDFFDD